MSDQDLELNMPKPNEKEKSPTEKTGTTKKSKAKMLGITVIEKHFKTYSYDELLKFKDHFERYLERRTEEKKRKDLEEQAKLEKAQNAFKLLCDSGADLNLVKELIQKSQGCILYRYEIDGTVKEWCRTSFGRYPKEFNNLVKSSGKDREYYEVGPDGLAQWERDKLKEDSCT